MSKRARFADSTIDTTVWLMVWHPERLAAWLERHPPGDELERIARSRLTRPVEETRRLSGGGT